MFQNFFKISFTKFGMFQINPSHFFRQHIKIFSFIFEIFMCTTTPTTQLMHQHYTILTNVSFGTTYTDQRRGTSSNTLHICMNRYFAAGDTIHSCKCTEYFTTITINKYFDVWWSGHTQLNLGNQHLFF